MTRKQSVPMNGLCVSRLCVLSFRAEVKQAISARERALCQLTVFRVSE